MLTAWEDMANIKSSPVLGSTLTVLGLLYLLACVAGKPTPFYWAAGGGLLVLGVRALRQHKRALLERRSDTCVACGYDLHGVPIVDEQSVCPECGHVVLRPRR